jgi:hypothetical protein
MDNIIKSGPLYVGLALLFAFCFKMVRFIRKIYHDILVAPLLTLKDELDQLKLKVTKLERNAYFVPDVHLSKVFENVPIPAPVYFHYNC